MSEVRTLTKIIEYCEDKLKSSSGEVKECLKEIKKIYYLKNYYDPQLSNYNDDWEDYEFTKEEVEQDLKWLKKLHKKGELEFDYESGL